MIGGAPEVRMEARPPKTDGLVADINPALGEEILEVSERGGAF